jgi:hypothetical protein
LSAKWVPTTWTSFLTVEQSMSGGPCQQANLSKVDNAPRRRVSG